mmetsp:Transcript_32289/g.63589  ORF Transcript_32289/g.63589 Transcript_32289/m.63589 type:complete len:134 (-) Transcript_32289:798-1199(-)
MERRSTSRLTKRTKTTQMQRYKDLLGSTKDWCAWVGFLGYGSTLSQEASEPLSLLPLPSSCSSGRRWKSKMTKRLFFGECRGGIRRYDEYRIFAPHRAQRDYHGHHEWDVHCHGQNWRCEQKVSWGEVHAARF